MSPEGEEKLASRGLPDYLVPRSRTAIWHFSDALLAVAGDTRKDRFESLTPRIGAGAPRMVFEALPGGYRRGGNAATLT